MFLAITTVVVFSVLACPSTGAEGALARMMDVHDERMVGDRECKPI